MRFEPSPEHRGAAHFLEERRGRDVRLQKQLTSGWMHQTQEQSEFCGPGWGWGGGAGRTVEGHAFQLSFPVIPMPGVGAELSIATGEGASAGCSPIGQVPHKERVLALELKVWP